MVTLTNTKTGRSERALSPDAWALLGEIPQRGRDVSPSPDKADAPRTEVNRVWQRVRNMVATIALSEDVPLAAVGALLGHRDPKTTLRYAKIEHAAARDAVAALGRVLSRPRVADDVIPLYRKRT
jgi:integrase